SDLRPHARLFVFLPVPRRRGSTLFPYTTLFRSRRASGVSLAADALMEERERGTPSRVTSMSDQFGAPASPGSSVRIHSCTFGSAGRGSGRFHRKDGGFSIG